MDATAQLALMTKAKLVFERDDTFLSFPALVPYSYDANQLDALSVQAPSPAQMLVLSEISRVVNSIPTGPLFSETDGVYLWEVLHQMFVNAVLATTDAGGVSSANYTAACAELYATTADGSRVDSPDVVAYNQYHDAYEATLSAYKSAQISAASTTDQQASETWTASDEPRLRAAVDAAMAAWTTQGGKLKVEQARQTLQVAAQINPQVTWSSWATSFNPDIDLLADPNQVSFALTGLSPSNFGETEWPTFTLDTSEISSLIAQAPAELSTILQTASQSEVASISFQYCAVSLVRPWFRPEAFAARFWKMNDPSMDLSDGKSPASGRLPAYVNGIVFARQVVVTPVATSAVQAQHVTSMPTLMLRPEVAAQMQQVKATNPVAGSLTHPMGARPMVMAHVGLTNQSAATISPAGASVQAMNYVHIQNGVMNPAPLMAVGARQIPPAAMNRLRLASFQSLPSPKPAAPPAASSSGSDTTATKMMVLAFICKRVPLCPNPDPTLAW